MTAGAPPTSPIPSIDHHEPTDDDSGRLNDVPAADDTYWDDRHQMTVIVADLPEKARGTAWVDADGSRVAVMSSVITVEVREACLDDLARALGEGASS